MSTKDHLNEDISNNANAAAMATDPLSNLSPTARALVGAARTVIAEGGIQSLTVPAVTHAAGVNRAAVSYHFDGKEGLLSAVLDSNVHRICATMSRLPTCTPPGRPRIAALLENIRLMLSLPEEHTIFFKMIPYSLNDPALHARIAALFDWYRDLNVTAFLDDSEIPDDDARAAATLVAAVADGLALASLIGGTNVCVEGALDLFEKILIRYFDKQHDR